MSRDWAPPVGQKPVGPKPAQTPDPPYGAGHPSDPYRDPFDTAADEVAPVDRQADPAHWLHGRALLITAAIIGLALLATIVVCLVIWLTPPMHHLQVPSVPRS